MGKIKSHSLVFLHQFENKTVPLACPVFLSRMDNKEWASMAKTGQHWPILDKWLDETSWFKTSEKWSKDPKCPDFARISNWLWSPEVQELQRVCQTPRQFFASVNYAIPDGAAHVCVPSQHLCRLIGNGLLELRLPRDTSTIAIPSVDKSESSSKSI
jgi:hypothetical protein